MARSDPGRRDLREPSSGIDDRCVAGRAAVRWMEGIRDDGEGRRWAVLRDAVPEGAVPDGDRGVSAGESRLAYDGLAAFVGPKLITEVPGPEALTWIERDRKVTSPSLPRAYPFAPRRGAGSIVEDVDGNIFLDLNAGIAVTSTGHCHPRVVAAVQEQAAELLHYSASDFYLPIYSRMCAALAATAPIPGPVRVFLTNSGAEAVEGALKLARYATGRPYVISFFGAFHGRSYGAMTLTASKAKYHQGFGPLVPGVLHAPYAYNRVDPVSGARSHDPDETFDYLENTLFRYQVAPSEVAAIFVEPVQGEGGYIVPPASWLARLRALCDSHGILLVADEVQSGMGRTGRMWAIEHSGVR